MTNRVVEAAGGVLYRKRDRHAMEVLLIYRRGVWDLPKGKLEKGESYEECALREVSEETGAAQLTIKETVAETWHEYLDHGENIGKKTVWFSMATKLPDFDPEPEILEEIERIEWVTLPEAKKRVGFDNLLNVLVRFEEICTKGENC